MALMQTAFGREPARELRVRQRIEQPDHADRDGALLDEVGHGLGDRDLFGVETDDEAGGDENAGGIDFVDTGGDVAAGGFLFFSSRSRVGGGGFYNHRKSEESCPLP